VRRIECPADVPSRPPAVSDAPGGDGFILRCSIEIASCLCLIGLIIGATVPEPVGWRTLRERHSRCRADN
jgi:hypothetical protein